MNPIADRLAATPLGEELGSEHCQTLASLMASVTLAPDERLFAAGDPGNALYIVTHGALEVSLSTAGQDDLVIAVLGPGGVVGELELFTGTERMANVVTTEETSCLRLPAESVKNRPAEQAAALGALVDLIAKVLAVRLAAVNRKLVAAWGLPEAGADADVSAPPLREVLDDVWRW